MTNQSAQPITEKNLAKKLSEAFDGREWKPVIDIIKEVTGHKFAPEPKPLPTEPGSVAIATEVQGVKGKWRMVRDDEEDWFSPVKIHGNHWHRPEHITAWTPVRVVPEGEPIDVDDVREGDRVRVEQDNGDEATFTVIGVCPNYIESKYDLFPVGDIRTIHLLHREEA